MRNGHLLLLIGMGLIFMGATCERPLDVTIDEPDPELVVVSNFTDDKEMMVQVMKSQSLLNPEPITYIEDAIVRLYEGEDLVQNLELVRDPFYRRSKYSSKNFTAVPNVLYTLSVQAPGFDEIIAKSMIPDIIEIQNLKVSNYVIETTPSGVSTYRFSVTIDFEDPEDLANFYHLNLFQRTYQVIVEGQDTSFREDVRQSIQFNQVIDNNFILANEGGGVLFDDTPFNGNIVSYTFPLELIVNSREKVIGDLLVELRSVSEDYYRFQRSLSQQQKNPGAPFAEPVILYNNVMNGQGIFAGYSSSIDSIRIGR